jgi:predicted nucleic acid-binding protein
VKAVVVDASALLPAWLPTERGQENADYLADLHARGEIEICAPPLLTFEILNALFLAIRGKAGSPPRLTPEGAALRWQAFSDLQITLVDTSTLAARIVELSLAHRRPSVYDMTYVALAEHLQATMVTADERLLNAVAPALPYVIPLWAFHPDSI